VHVANRVFDRQHPFATLVELILLASLGALFPHYVVLVSFLVYVASGPVGLARARLRRGEVSEGRKVIEGEAKGAG
jgi:hypothetical protein